MKSNSTFAKFALGFSAAAFAVGAFGAVASAEGQGNFKFKKFNRDRQILVSNNGGNGKVEINQRLSVPKSDVVEKKKFPTLVASKSDVADVGGSGKPLVVFSSRPKSDVADNNPPARVKKLKPSGFQVVDVTPKRAISIVQKEPPRKSSSQQIVISKSDPVDAPVFVSQPKKVFKFANAPKPVVSAPAISSGQVEAFVDPTAASGSELALADTDQAQQLKDLGIDPSQLKGVHPGDKIVIEIREEKVKAQPKVRYVYQQAPAYSESDSYSSGYNSYHPQYVGQSYSDDSSYETTSSYSSGGYDDNCNN